jgi:hypothetical protein
MTWLTRKDFLWGEKAKILSYAKHHGEGQAIRGSNEAIS